LIAQVKIDERVIDEIERHREEKIGTKMEEDDVKKELSGTAFVITGVISTLKRGVKGDGLTLSLRGRPLYTVLFMRSKGARHLASPARYRKDQAAGSVKAGTARVAIVLDDFGYNMNNVDYLFEAGEPVTLSILPGLSYSGKVANAARENGYESILHLPLEPYDGGGRLEKNTIMSDMDEDEILSLLNAALESVPYVKGVSNHMGSKATGDARVMGIIFRELKKRGLFFLDSLSTSESVCGDVAREAGMGYARRSIFLDNESDPEYIRGQLQHLAEQAVETGSAIGIGHDRVNTVEVIREMAQDMKGRGIRFVFLSELVK